MMGQEVMVRDAEESDIPLLTAIKGAGSEALHRDRLRDARHGGFRYLVLSVGQDVIGFACLVFRRPDSWSDAEDSEHLPQIVDLLIKETMRSQGYGTILIHAIEQLAAAQTRQIYLGAEPLDNPRAYALYQRLGYQPLQSEPYLRAWEFMDSAGKVHHGEDWVVDMVKQL